MKTLLDYFDEVIEDHRAPEGEYPEGSPPIVVQNPDKDGVGDHARLLGITAEDGQRFRDNYHDLLIDIAESSCPIEIPLDLEVMLGLISGKMGHHAIVNCSTLLNIAFNFAMFGVEAERKRSSDVLNG